jgi:hypothetical protein
LDSFKSTAEISNFCWIRFSKKWIDNPDKIPITTCIPKEIKKSLAGRLVISPDPGMYLYREKIMPVKRIGKKLSDEAINEHCRT